MRQFSDAIDGIAEACRALDTPITGGNVSFYNETLGRGIYPTPTIGILGVLDDASHALGMGFRAAGDVIVLLDGAGTAGVSPASLQTEFSSSEYAKRIHGIVGGTPPPIDLAAERRLIDALVAMAAAGVLHSAHDVSDGGLAVALAESCFASCTAGILPASEKDAAGTAAVQPLGADVALTSDAPAEFALFHERGARAVVSCAPAALARVEALARQYGVAAQDIGRVSEVSFRIQHGGCLVTDTKAAALREIWSQSLEQLLTPK